MHKHRFWSLFVAFLLACGIPAFAADNPGDDVPPAPGSKQDDSADPNKSDGDPFYLHTGEFYFSNSFLAQPGPLKLQFAPRYSTLSDFHGPLGYGWTHNYNWRFYRTDDGGVAIRSGLGKVINYTPVAGQPGNFISQDKNNQIATVAGDGSATLTLRDQSRFYFDTLGRLSKITNGKGAELRMTYDAAGLLPILGIPKKSNRTSKFVVVRDYRLTRVDGYIGNTANGHSLIYSYDGDGHIASVTDSRGRSIVITYDGTKGDLLKLTDPENEDVNFTYYPTNRLMKTYEHTGWKHGTIRTNVYDSNERLLTQTQGSGTDGETIQVTTYAADRADTTHQIKNSAGTVTGTRYERTYFIVDAYGVKQVSKRIVRRGAAFDENSSETDDFITSYTYDAATGRVLTTTLPNGGVVTTGYDANGNVTQISRQITSVAPLYYHVSQFQYDANNNRTRTTIYQTDRPTEKAITCYIYDAQNRKTQEKRVKNPTAAEASWAYVVTQYFYDADGRLTKTVDPRGLTTRYEYLNATFPNRVTRKYDEATPTVQTTYTYAADDLSMVVTDALGRPVTQEFDKRGRLRKVTNALGIESHNRYTAGNLTEIEVGKLGAAAGRITRFVYNNRRQLTSMKRVNDLGTEVTFETVGYDNEGRVLSRTNALGQVSNFEYETTGWMTKAKLPYSATETSDTRSVYDKAGNVTSNFDALNVETRYQYDLLRRMTKKTEAFGTADERIVEYAYDLFNNVVQIKRTKGTDVAITNYAYDTFGRMVAQSGAREFTTTYGYNDAGDVTSVTDGRGNTTQYQYDVYGRPTAIIYADDANYVGGNSTTTGYDVVGNVLKTVDGNGNQHHYHYDALNRLTHVSVPVVKGATIEASWWTNPALVLESRVYNAWNEITNRATLQGGTSSATYDRFGRVTTVTDESGLTVTHGYNAADQRTSITYPAVNVGDAATTEVLTYNARNALMLDSVKDRSNNLTSYTYSKRFQRLTEVSSLGATTTNVYDNLARLTSSTNHVGDQTSFKYDQFNQVVEQTYPDHVAGTNVRVRTFTYNTLGQILTESGAGGYTLTYTYDAAGNAETMTDAKSSSGGPGAGVTTWEYDSRNRIKKKIFADGKFYTYTYDGAGNVATRTDAKGSLTSYTYNKFNRLGAVDYPSDPDISFGYDDAGRRVQMVDASGTSTWTYDAANRTTSYTHSLTGYTVGYAYSNENRRTTLDARSTGVGSGWITTYGYDAAHRLKTIVDPLVSPNPFTYTWKSNANLIQQVAYPGGGNTTKTYDVLGRITAFNSVDGASTPGAINGWTFSYNKVGLLKDETRANDSYKKIFGYDDKYQLASANRQDASAVSDPSFQFGYNYDAIGNRTAVTAPSSAGGNRTFTVNQSNQYTVVDTVAMTHDFNGNLTSDGTRSFFYDEENRLSTVTFPGSTAKSEFLYDGLGRVIEKKVTDAFGAVSVTRYVLDNNLPIRELDGSGGIIRSITRGLDLSLNFQGSGGIGGLLALTEGSTPYFYFSDPSGNVTDVVNPSGWARSAHYEYDPFGQKIVSSGALVGQPYQWSSKPFESQSGLIDFGRRFYNPTLGRWMSRDPMAERGGVNLYAAFLNDPINQGDAWGFFSFLKWLEDRYNDAVDTLTDARDTIADAFSDTMDVLEEAADYLMFDPSSPISQGLDLIVEAGESIREVASDVLDAGANFIAEATIGWGQGNGIVPPNVAIEGGFWGTAGRVVGLAAAAYQGAMEVAAGGALIFGGGVGGAAAAPETGGASLLVGAEAIAKGSVIAGHGLWVMGNVINAIGNTPEGSGGSSSSGELPTHVVDGDKYPNHADVVEEGLQKRGDNVFEKVDPEQAARNRYEAQKDIRKTEGPPAAGQNYDEFPYASTKQGGQGAAIKSINAKENQAAGRELKEFYQENKIKPGDSFKVEVKRTAPGS